jgi:hypothetical protein
MRSRLATTLFLAACVLVAVPTAARAQSLLFDYVGFDYENPKAPGSQFGDVGNGYVGLGTVPFLFAPLVSNTTLNEYTFVIDGLTSTGFVTVGPFRVVNYTPGTLTLYEDAKSGGTTADFGTLPPNLVAPPTFTDGTAILVGQLTDFRFAIDNSNGTGSFEAVFTVTGGTQAGNFPLNQRVGWTFSGSTGNALNIPAGYAHQIDGQAFLNEPVSVRRTSWGRLKAGYR